MILHICIYIYNPPIKDVFSVFPIPLPCLLTGCPWSRRRAQARLFATRGSRWPCFGSVAIPGRSGAGRLGDVEVTGFKGQFVVNPWSIGFPSLPAGMRVLFDFFFKKNLVDLVGFRPLFFPTGCPAWSHYRNPFILVVGKRPMTWGLKPPPEHLVLGIPGML